MEAGLIPAYISYVLMVGILVEFHSRLFVDNAGALACQ